MNNPFATLLQTITLETLLQNQFKHSILSFSEETTVEQAVNSLCQHRFLSAPVLHSQTGKCVGNISMLDIVSHIVKVTDPNNFLDLNSIRFAVALNLVPLKSIINTVEPFVPFNKTDDALQLTKQLANGVHRVVVWDEGQNVVGTISQSNVLKAVFAQVEKDEKLKQIVNKPLEQLGFVLQQSVVSVKHNQTILEAFQTINEYQISAVAVVNAYEGQICGNFSSSDLRGLFSADWPNFSVTVETYLKNYSAHSLAPVVCFNNCTLYKVMQELAKSDPKGHSIHRVWIVDTDRVPIGVVSLTDVMRFFLQYQ